MRDCFCHSPELNFATGTFQENNKRKESAYIKEIL